jgi:nicotinamidase-related amidase
VKPDLTQIAAPGHTAIVTQECQGAVVGPNAGLAVLAKEARREALPNIERLLPAARDAGVKIVHCLVQRRPDGLGGNHNAKIFAVGSGVDLAPGSRGTSLLPELGPAQRMWCYVGRTASARWVAPTSTSTCATSGSRRSWPSAYR